MREVRHAASARQPRADAVCRSNRPFTWVRSAFRLSGGGQRAGGLRPERKSTFPDMVLSFFCLSVTKGARESVTNLTPEAHRSTCRCMLRRRRMSR
jgi:hypothetical protein